MLPHTKILLPDKTVRTQEKLAVFLAFIAGYTDATRLIQWKTYVSFMSGNTTQLGAAVFSEKYGVIISSVIIISFFFWRGFIQERVYHYQRSSEAQR